MKHVKLCYVGDEFCALLCEENCSLCKFYLIHDENFLWDLHAKRHKKMFCSKCQLGDG